ncbi:DNA-binding transcriptional regulator [bacterium]|nr:DNA-binding transcriptional regulator [bacterium]
MSNCVEARGVTTAGSSSRTFQSRVALLVDLATSFGRRVLEGVHSHPARQNWELLAESWGDFGAGDLLEGDRPDGIIFDGQSPELLQALTKVRLPMVDVQGVLNDGSASSVTADYDQVGRVAAGHLRERGFNQTGFLGLKNSPVSDLIEQAFVTASGEYTRQQVRFQTSLDWSGQQREFRQELSEWLESLPRPCGVLAADDVAARRLLQACRRLNVRVPEDLGVIGVGNYEMVTAVSDPTLSSVVIPARAIGYQAADSLHQMLSGGSISRIRLPAPAVAARHSTDLLAFESGLMRQAMEWMQAHLTESVRIPALSSHLCVSRRLLEQHFQTALGYGPAEQLRRLRLRRAEQLLRESDLSLAVISRMSGLVTAERLCVLFRQYLNLTPGEYRKMLTQPERSQFSAEELKPKQISG